jgi:vacuole morphology and inheritance protein 14
MDELFPALLKTLSDPAEDVVRLDLQVLAKLSANDVYFDKLMNSLINSFRKDRKLLEHRGNLIVRQLSLSIKAEKIYRALSVILETEEDFEFASTLIQTLNLILLTATELFEVRTALKSLLTDTSSQELFTVLYRSVLRRLLLSSSFAHLTSPRRSWCHNPTAVFSLCLLSQVYEHSSNLVQKLFVPLFLSTTY